MPTEAISAFPGVTPTSVSGILLADGDGSQAPLGLIFETGALCQPSVSSASGTDELLVVQGGATKLVPIHDIDFGGEGVSISYGSYAASNIQTLSFTGAGVSVSGGGPNRILINIPGGSVTGGGGINLSDGTNSVAGATSIYIDNGLTLGTSTVSGAAATIHGAAGSSWSITDGTHSVSGITNMVLSGGLTVTGDMVHPGHVTVTGATGGGGGGGGTITLGIPGTGASMLGRTEYNRPLLSDMTLINAQTTDPSSASNISYIGDYLTGGAKSGPLVISNFFTGTGGGACIAHGQTGTFSVIAEMCFNAVEAQPVSGLEAVAGIGFYDPTSGNSAVVGGTVSNNNGSRMIGQAFDSSGNALTSGWSYGQFANGLSKAAQIEAGSTHWHKLSWNGSTFDWYTSRSGFYWVKVAGNINLSAAFTGVPSHICFMLAPGTIQQGFALEIYNLYTITP